MKTNIITQWAALLLTVSGMAALPLSVSAAPKVVTTIGTTYDANNSYESVTGTTALHVNGSGVVYSGTNIKMTGLVGSAAALIANYAEAYLYGGTASGAGGIWLSAGAKGTFSAVTVSVGGRGYNIIGTSTVTIIGGSVSTTNDDSHAIAIENKSMGYLENVQINTTGVGSTGVLALTNATVNINGGSITTAQGRGVVAAFGSNVSVTDLVVTTAGDGNNGIALEVIGANSQMTVNGGTYATSGSAAHGAEMFYQQDNSLVLNGATISTAGVDTDGVHLAGSGAVSGSYAVTVNGGNVNADQGSAIKIVDESGGMIDYDIQITGGAELSGTAALVVNGTGTQVTVAVEGNSTLNGGITASGSSNTNVNLDNSSVTGDVSASGSATLTVSLDNNSTLTGKANSADLSVINNSTWNMTADSQVNNLLINSGGKVIFKKDAGYKTLTVGNLSGSGEFHMNTDIAANTGDLLDITGTSAGSHQVRITNHGNNTAGTEPALLLVRTADGQAAFSGTVSVGMFDYSLYKDGGDWYLSVSGTNLPPNPPDPDPTDPNPPTPPTPQPGDVGKDILTNSPGGQAPGWFDHNDNIGNHLTDLRDSNRNATVSGRSGGDKDVALTAGSILNSVWIKAYGAQLNISGRVAGVGVREFDYGTDIGADHQWNLDHNNTLIAGVFVGYGRTDRETRNNFGGESNTDAFRLGLYGIWLNNSGWFADLIAKGQYNDSTISTYDASYNHTTADYDNWGGGLSADFGKRFDFEHGWFVEPSVSAAYAHLTGSDYTTGGDNIFSVSTTDADVFQFKIGVAFGRTIKLTNSGVLQPYIKVAGVEQISTGGKLSASGHEWRPNFDGARAEVGGGIIWQLNADHQLSLDYEASFGDKYDKPWGLTAGYRYQF